jgi:hypothetical protein
MDGDRYPTGELILKHDKGEGGYSFTGTGEKVKK